MERTRRRKGIIAYNTATASGNLNLVLMEAMHTLAVKKQQIKTLGRKYIGGSVSYDDNMKTPTAKEETWKESVDKKIASLRQRHVDAIEKMKAEASEKEKQLRREIEMHQERINRSQTSVDALTESLKSFNIPDFDPGAIGDIERQRRSNQASKDIIARARRDRLNTTIETPFLM